MAPLDGSRFRTPEHWSATRRKNADRVFRGGLLLAQAVNRAAESQPASPSERPATAANHSQDNVVFLVAPGTPLDGARCRVERSPLYDVSGVAHLELLDGRTVGTGKDAYKHLVWPWEWIRVGAGDVVTREEASAAPGNRSTAPPRTAAEAERRVKQRLRAYFDLRWSRPILQRDGYRCQRCGASDHDDGVRLEVHHKLRFADIVADLIEEGGYDRSRIADWEAIETAAKADPRLNDSANGVTLCEQCHAGAGSEVGDLD